MYSSCTVPVQVLYNVLVYQTKTTFRKATNENDHHENFRLLQWPFIKHFRVTENIRTRCELEKTCSTHKTILFLVFVWLVFDYMRKRMISLSLSSCNCFEKFALIGQHCSIVASSPVYIIPVSTLDGGPTLLVKGTQIELQLRNCRKKKIKLLSAKWYFFCRKNLCRKTERLQKKALQKKGFK